MEQSEWQTQKVARFKGKTTNVWSLEEDELHNSRIVSPSFTITSFLATLLDEPHTCRHIEIDWLHITHEKKIYISSQDIRRGLPPSCLDPVDRGTFGSNVDARWTSPVSHWKSNVPNCRPGSRLPAVRAESTARRNVPSYSRWAKNPKLATTWADLVDTPHGSVIYCIRVSSITNREIVWNEWFLSKGKILASRLDVRLLLLHNIRTEWLSGLRQFRLNFPTTAVAAACVSRLRGDPMSGSLLWKRPSLCEKIIGGCEITYRSIPM